MSLLQMDAFHLIGISAKTSNDPGFAEKDIPALWTQWLTGGYQERINNRLDQDIYCVYTDYEGDHTSPYTVFLGCKVSSVEDVPEGLSGRTFASATYQQFTAKGNIQEGSVFHAWQQIWGTPLSRTFVADFERYDHRATEGPDAEVDLFIGIEP